MAFQLSLTESYTLSGLHHQNQLLQQSRRGRRVGKASLSRQDQQQQLLPRQQDEDDASKPAPTWKRFLLICGLFGTESVTAFEQIHTYLSLQFLGVPVSLMSVNGIIAGITAILLIPTFGVIVDRGENPKKRKMVALLIGLVVLTCGFIQLLIAASLKLTSTSLAHRDDHNSSLIGSKTSALDINTSFRRINFGNESSYTTPDYGVQTAPAEKNDSSNSDFRQLMPSLENLTSNDADDYQDTGSASLTFIGILGILGYASLDIGFDLGNPMVRAFVMEHTPPEQHTNMLVTATCAAAWAGMLTSMLGVLDLPSLLEAKLQIDGTAAFLIVMVCVLVVIVSAGYLTTIFAGLSISKSMTKLSNTSLVSGTQHKNAAILPGNKGRVYSDADIRQKLRKNSKLSAPLPITAGGVDDSGRVGYDSVYDAVKSDDRKRLLNSNRSACTEDSHYQTFSNQVVPLETASSVTASHESISGSPALIMRTAITDYESSTDTALAQSSVSYQASLAKEQVSSQQRRWSSQVYTGLSDANKGIKIIEGPIHGQSSKAQEPFFTKRLIVLVIASSFSISAMICFIMFIPNALTVGILHGDPTARPGTPGFERYTLGLRTASMGSLVFYISYFVFCLLSGPLFRLVGERPYFILCHIIMVASAVSFVLTKSMTVYYICMVALGPYRTCIYTLTFLLASQYAGAQDTSQDQASGSKSSRNGRVTALIGVVLPCNYVAVSSIMAPLIDYTGNVFLPLIWAAISYSLSIIVFSILFFL